MFLMPLESGQTARLITSLASFFCSLQRQTEGGGGGWEAQLGWRENKRAGAVFMVFLHPAKKR